MTFIYPLQEKLMLIPPKKALLSRQVFQGENKVDILCFVVLKFRFNDYNLKF